mmetsp:Transcript_43647/g.85633  ORF Transcript_43647/g.85633 Transcript_43647/m.85633 type:complete len:130 (+) Transcript_43647:101-490(+)
MDQRMCPENNCAMNNPHIRYILDNSTILKMSSNDKDDNVCISCSEQRDASQKESSMVQQGESIVATGPLAGVYFKELYRSMSECMSSNKGRISACSSEWSSFQECHGRLSAVRKRVGAGRGVDEVVGSL